MDVSLKKCQRSSSLGSESIQGSDLSKEHKTANRHRHERIKREAKGKEKTVIRTRPVDYKAMPRIRSSTLPRPVRSTTDEMDLCYSRPILGRQSITQPDKTTVTSESGPQRNNDYDFIFHTGELVHSKNCINVTTTRSPDLDLNLERNTAYVYLSHYPTNHKRNNPSVVFCHNPTDSATFTFEGHSYSGDLGCSNITLNGDTNFKISESGYNTRTLNEAANIKTSESGYSIITLNGAANIKTSETNNKGSNTSVYVHLNQIPTGSLSLQNSVFDWNNFPITFHRATNIPTSESGPQSAIQVGNNFLTSESDFLSMEETKEDNVFLVLSDINFLPRYKYHRSLLDWFIGGLPQDPAFLECCFIDCSIIVGGNLGDEKQKQLFDEALLLENMAPLNLQKDTTALTDVLVVYFYSGGVVAHMHREITKLRNHHMFGEGTILVVMTTDHIDNKRLKFTIVEKMTTLRITSVEFVIEIRSEIIKKITCILEQRLTEYLTQTKIKLMEHSSLAPNVRQSLLEVNAIIRKLKQAACYPESLEEDGDGEKTVDKEIDEILQRFRDNILYQGYDGDKLYVITNDQSVKENLEAWFLESGIENLQLVISFEETLSTTELSKRGEPLNGAKFVYEHNSVSDFKEDKCYATIGCLMLASNNMMVAVTCQHAVDRKENFYTLINNSVVKLGKELPQVNKQMARLYEDIALIVIDGETRNDIDNYCERLLIDSCGVPSPAEIASEGLKKGDIVHKWGATTGLTTGIVKEVEHQAIGRFTSESTVIYITGRDSEPFANDGDSGSLIFKHSESPEQNCLYVYAVVQSRLKLPFVNADIICFLFKESYDSLKNNLPDIQTLQFCKV